MSVTNIIILTESPFSKRDFDRFGVALLRNSFQVSILDCTPWLKPKIWTKYSELAFRCSGYLPISNRDALIKGIDSSAETLVIDYLGNCRDSRRVRIHLKKKNIRRVIVHNGILPTPSVNWYRKIGRTISQNTAIAILKKLYGRFEQSFSQAPMPEIALLSGIAGLNDKRLHGLKSKIWAHSFDFDIYLANEKHAGSTVEPYAVFLDEDMIYHSDYDHLEIKSPATEITYYASMNGFFEKLERKLGMPVMIAAHPRSRYDLRPQLWNGRKTITGKTAELVRDAKLVLCHQSTAVSFAVMWRKPILFLTTNELKSSYLQPGIEVGSALLVAPSINVDKNEELLATNLLYSVDGAAYEKYAEEYIKRPGTPNLPAWQIFAEYVQREC